MIQRDGRKPRHLRSAVWLLPCASAVAVTAYSQLDPVAWDIPHVFQFACILLGAALTVAACSKVAPRRAAIRTGRSTRQRP